MIKRWPLLIALSLLLLPAYARPPRHNHARHTPAAKAAHALHSRAKHHPAAVVQNAAARHALNLLLLHGDPQTLVILGKKLPFYDPADLSKVPVISAPAAIIIDADTGETLWAKNADTRRFPASTTKILTSLLFIEHTNPDDIITCNDPNIAKVQPSSLGIKPGEKFTASDLLYGTLIRSANDGAVVMAEQVAGSVPKFAELMNARAAEIGALHSHFVTPNGLHDPNHYTTARDMALIAREAMRNQRFEDAVGTPERTIARSIVTRDTHIVSHIKGNFYDKFPGADGIKTGFTNQARHCFVGSATRDGRRLISVVFGSHNSGVTDTIPMLDWAFLRFSAVSLAKRYGPTAPVAVRGAAHVVPTVARLDLHASFDSLEPATRTAFRSEIVPLPHVFAPVTKGEMVGTLMVKAPDGTVVAETPLLAAENVGRSPIAAATSPGALWFLCGAICAGAVTLLLVRFRYGATSAKGARLRRGGIAPPGRGADRIG